MKFPDLSYNYITTLPPASFPSGQSLQFLSLVHNDIELLETNCFDDLTQLEVGKGSKIVHFLKKKKHNSSNFINGGGAAGLTCKIVTAVEREVIVEAFRIRFVHFQ